MLKSKETKTDTIQNVRYMSYTVNDKLGVKLYL